LYYNTAFLLDQTRIPGNSRWHNYTTHLLRLPDHAL
jgi:hypothetical protein